jgi:hypothetical protein
LFESGLKVVKIVDGLAEGYGVRLTASIQLAYGFGIEMSAPFGAERPVAPPSLEPTWRPMATDAPSIEFGLAEGKPDDRVPRASSVRPYLQWYELEATSAQLTRVRAGVLDSGLLPDASRAHKLTTVLALTAPVRDVLGESSGMSPHAVVTHAARLGAIARVNETGVWHLNTGRGDLAPHARRRRRIKVIAYFDPISGFIATVKMSSDGAARFRYLVLDPNAVPQGVEADVLVVRTPSSGQ